MNLNKPLHYLILKKYSKNILEVSYSNILDKLFNNAILEKNQLTRF